MSEFDYDAFTQQLKAKLAEDKTPKPSRTLHLELCGDPFDPLTAINIRHIRAAVRAYAAERAASNEPLLKVETHRVSSFLVPGYCSMPSKFVYKTGAVRARGKMFPLMFPARCPHVVVTARMFTNAVIVSGMPRK